MAYCSFRNATYYLSYYDIPSSKTKHHSNNMTTNLWNTTIDVTNFERTSEYKE